MVRRSSRLRDKVKALNSEVKKAPDDEKDGSQDLESLARAAYAVIKQKVESYDENYDENWDENCDTDKMGKEDTSSARTKDYVNISSSVKAKVSDCHTLASELNPGLDSGDLYFKMNESNSRPVSSDKINRLQFNDKQIMKKCIITADFEKKERAPPIHVSYNSMKKQKKIEKDKSAGSSWFNMPAPEMTPELQRDLNIIRMRGVLDPKRHYKKNNSKKLPKYFQIGTVMSGPADFYSSCIPKSKRKGTIIDSLLSDAEFRRYNKRKYLEIQATKEGGKKGFYRRSKKKRR